MSSWKQVRFSEICDITRGGSPRPIQEYMTNDGVPWIKISDATASNSRFIEKTKEFIKTSGISKSREVFPDDLILSNSATPGIPKFMRIYACIHDGWLLLRNFNGAEKEFIYWLLLNERDKLIQQGNGSVFTNLKTDILKNHIVNIPDDIEEQKRIATILNNIQEKIELNTQINQTLEQIAQTIFKSWFIDFDPVHAKANALASGQTLEQATQAAMAVISGKNTQELHRLQTANPEKYQQLWEIAEAFPSGVDEKRVPRGWAVKRIEDVIRKIPTGKKYSQKTAFEVGNIPILDQGKSGVIGYHNDEAGVKASIENPVIVFANHTCYMRLISYDFSAIQNVFAFVGKESNVLWTYLATLGKQEFTEYKGHFPDFLIKEIIVPNNELTELFGVVVKEHFQQIACNDKQNKTLANVRDLLLPKLLSGEV